MSQPGTTPRNQARAARRGQPPAETAVAVASRCLTLAAHTAAWAGRRAARTPLLPARVMPPQVLLPVIGVARLRELPGLLTGPLRIALARLDLTGLVLAVVDLDRIAARLDLEAILGRVDVDAVVARADLDLVINRLDLIGLARYVVDGIDLPDLVRESTGSVTSEMVRDVRTQSAAADQQLERAIDRLLLRRHDRGEPARGTVPPPAAAERAGAPHQLQHPSGDELDGRA
ncbi:MAG TPA: hypothetical protein VMB79_14200 [Jatrophihabitans sp.]|nr:hypothetical protein [Jatrophihabitans sp.]